MNKYYKCSPTFYWETIFVRNYSYFEVKVLFEIGFSNKTWRTFIVLHNLKPN
jgi:hypothetical protein